MPPPPHFIDLGRAKQDELAHLASEINEKPLRPRGMVAVRENAGPLRVVAGWWCWRGLAGVAARVAGWRDDGAGCP
jgi:DMSO/TMAO reductase YedYZ molybdopterin-dependent catalytic subunit